MSWDWEKLKEQQQKMGGGVPPNVDEFVQKLKNIKFPGGPILIVVLLVLAAVWSSIFTVKQDEVGVVQLFGRYVRSAQRKGHPYRRIRFQIRRKHSPIAFGVQ